LKAEYAGTFFFAIYIFAISNTISPAAISISFALLILLLLVQYGRGQLKLPVPGMNFQVPWWTFFITTLAASLLIADTKSIAIAMDYLYRSLPFWVLLVFYYRYPKLEALAGAIAATLLLIGADSLYVYYFVNHMSKDRVQTFAVNLNGFGTIIAMSIPFMCSLLHHYYKNNKIMTLVLSVSSILGIAGLIFTGSRGAIVGFVLGALILAVTKGLIFRQRKHTGSVVTALVICIAVCVAFVNFQGRFSHGTDNQRPLFIRSSYAMWKDHPVIGVGLANWQEAYYSQYKLPEAIEKNIPMPHNTVAYYFSTTGIIGGLGFSIFSLGILIYLIKKMQEQPDNYIIQAMFWSFLAVSIHGLVDAGLSMRTALRLCSAYMGVTVASILIYEKTKLRKQIGEKHILTPEEYRKQRYYGQMIGHRNDREDFR
jgi:hypothetical protein